jgi:hypothetical protein
MVSNNLCIKVNMILNEEDSTECIALKATKNKPEIKYVTLIVKYVCLLSLLFYVAYYNCKCHSDISTVFIKYY